MDDSFYDPPAGYALRKNGTCGADQETCGNPWLDWHNCCPKGTECNEHNTCCPEKAGCEQWLVEDPHCANNKTWDLYETEPGGNFFCCLSTSSAYLAGGLESNGSATTGIACADGIPDGAKDEALVPVARGTAYQSSTNKGAIAGGVVGGCAGLALIIALVWFLMRRRRQQARATDPLTSSDPSTPAQDKKGVYGFELDNNAVRPELQGNPNTMAHELPPDTVPQELPASPVR